MSEPADHDALTSSFQRLQSLLLGLKDLETFLQELAQLAAGVVNPPVSCGITLRRDGRPMTVTSSDSRASALDETQYQTHEGPCLHSMHTGEIVSIPDMGAEDRWPSYSRRAREQGLRCSLSLPLTAQGRTLGAMNVYAFEAASSLSGERRRSCEIFAAQASGALHLASMQTRDARVRAQLGEALESRSVIDQAIGILMAEQRCDAESAFALLRQRSQSSQQKLRDVASDLVTRVGGRPPSPGKRFDLSGAEGRGSGG